MKKPGDPWGTPGNRWDAGATRVTWRVGTHALVTDDPNAHKWAERIIEVFKEGGADENILKISSGYNPVTGASLNWGAAPTTMAGAGVCGMVTGDQKIVDGAYDFLAKWPIPSEPGRIGNMDDAMAVMGLCIMTGLFSTGETVADPTSEIVSPGAPGGVNATAITSNSIVLTWAPVEEAFGYYVELKDGGSYKRLADVNRNLNSYVATGLSPSTQYEFRIAAYTRAGTSDFSTVSGSTTAPSPGELVYAVNCGGPQYTASNGVFFQADENFSGGMNNPRYFDIEGTDDEVVYASERFGTFSYAIPLQNGDYRVELLFAEAFWQEPNKRIFDAQVEGKSFSTVDIAAEVGARTAMQKGADVTVSDGKLDVRITTKKDNGTLQGIVVYRPGEGQPVVGVVNPSAGIRAKMKETATRARIMYDCRGRRIGTAGERSARRSRGLLLMVDENGQVRKRSMLNR
jgi:hypothetical protein